MLHRGLLILMLKNKKLHRISKYLLFWITNVSAISHATNYSLSVDYRAMDENWPLLPSVPASFQTASDFNYSLSADLDRFGVEFERSNLNLELVRIVEPKDVSLSGKKTSILLNYKLSNYQKIILHRSTQKAAEQRFECYNFNGITLGSCESADIQIVSSDNKYEALNGYLISIDAKTKTFGLSFFQLTDSIWIDNFSLGFYSTTHDYNWITPVEDLTSPFILGLTFDGQTLGASISETFDKLPQRNSWRLNQINLSSASSMSISRAIKIFADTEFVFLKHSNYRAVKNSPDYNIKVRMGFRYARRIFLSELYTNYYHHNLIGFEPITFNQRTEHRFDEPYGNFGLRFEWRI